MRGATPLFLLSDFMACMGTYIDHTKKGVPKNTSTYKMHYDTDGGPDSSVGIATRYRPDGPGIECRWGP